MWSSPYVWRQTCVNFSPEFSTSTNCTADPTQGVIRKVLRSDKEQLSEEFASAGETLKQGVIKRWRSLVREREDVGDSSVPSYSVNPFIFQFSNVMLELERFAEKSKENARADVQKRRIERCVVDIYSPAKPTDYL